MLPHLPLTEVEVTTLEAAAAASLTLLFLPHYSPELNKIERLWYHCKHYWIRPEDYDTDRNLLERIKYILTRVGNEFTILMLDRHWIRQIFSKYPQVEVRIPPCATA